MFQATFHSGSMNDPRMCEDSNASRRLLQDEDLDIDHLGHVAVKGVFASAVLATIAAFGLIQLFRKAPQTMIVIGCSLPVRSLLLRGLLGPFKVVHSGCDGSPHIYTARERASRRSQCTT